jgi:protein TonB
MAAQTQYRGRISALISALLHAVMLAVFAVTSIRIAQLDRNVIPLVIRQPAPPPPPPGAGAGPPAAAAVPLEPQLIDKAKPIESKPVEQPKPQEKPKIAARPKATRVVAKSLPTPAAEVPAASAPADAVAGGDAASGVGGGVVGGMAGGKVGGKLGGRLGGSGDDVWNADQVAVPPKVLETVPPQYPAMARARGQEGVVVVQAIIDRSGDVEPAGVRVIKSLPPFDEPAVNAFRRWKFKPGSDDSGQYVRVLVQQPIRFQLR